MCEVVGERGWCRLLTEGGEHVEVALGRRGHAELLTGHCDLHQGRVGGQASNNLKMIER